MTTPASFSSPSWSHSSHKIARASAHMLMVMIRYLSLLNPREMMFASSV